MIDAHLLADILKIATILITGALIPIIYKKIREREKNTKLHTLSKTNIDNLCNRIDRMCGRIENVDEKVDKQVNNLYSEINNVESDLSSFKEVAMTEKKCKKEQRLHRQILKSVCKKIENTNETLGNINEELKDLNKGTHTNSEKLASLEATIESLKRD